MLRLAPLLLLGLAGCFGTQILGRAIGQQFADPAPAKGARPEPIEPAHGRELRVAWIGHASLVVQLGDRTVLTDPVFTSSVGQLSKRLVAPGVLPSQLPRIDAVLVSHMHFDHLSLGSLDAIEDKVTRLFVPRGGVAYVPDYRFDVRELQRWQTFDDGGLRITAVPVRHIGHRYALDDAWMTTSFTGYVVEHAGRTVYFAGDTAYDRDAFRATHERFPHIDVALLPIAPISPRDFMKKRHMSPDEAVQAFLDLGASVMVPMHHSTFLDSTDEPGDAPRLLADAWKAHGLAPERLRVLAAGERVDLTPR